MPIDESVEPTAAGLLSLAARRPGHALMAGLIHELDRNGYGDVVPPDLQSRYIGAEGEVLVGQELARLPPEWKVLHSIPVGHIADIDHLLFGPPGVFVVNTKHHPGKSVTIGTHLVWVNGAKASGYQRHLADRAVKVRGALGSDAVPDLRVQPLLVFVGTRGLRTSGDQTVASIGMSGLIAYLESRPPRLTAEQVGHLHDLAARPATWGRGASVLHEPDPTARFLRLLLGTPTPVSQHSRPTPTYAPGRPLLARRRGAHRQVGVGCLALALAATAGPLITFLTLGLLTHLLEALTAR